MIYLQIWRGTIACLYVIVLMRYLVQFTLLYENKIQLFIPERKPQVRLDRLRHKLLQFMYA